VGLALATDLAPVEKHPQVVALLCMMLLLGMVASALWFGWVLAPFSELKLIKAIQGAAVLTVLFNGAALWKQEARNPALTSRDLPRPSFRESWREFDQGGRSRRRLVALGFGTVAFSMQDILLEPYGGQVLHLSVSETTVLTALLAAGGLVGFGTAAKLLGRGFDPYRLAAVGALVGLVAFTSLIFAAPFGSVVLFGTGVALIGLGAGLFGHCTLTAAMAVAGRGQIGLALGIWGAVQASAAGVAVASGGLIRDGISALAMRQDFGATLADPATGYGAVYMLEIGLLFATLIALGPLASASSSAARPRVDTSLIATADFASNPALL
jgi:BCD family chlorophyll transporter-like MFS transporter